MSLPYYYELLREKKEQLRRLQHCQGELQGSQQEFNYYKRLVADPQLSAATWKGMRASEFDQIRNGPMMGSYEDIIGPQFSAALGALSTKIIQIEGEIQSIRQVIANLEAEERRERERAQAAK
ncbi:YwqH-like family protein [Bacillus sp. T33-2]|uniref:YwqH-like family protein n=1 Tax=Bacillus sp. T33-2 TaxID=2054168 RepID=UPI000C768662|nr:DUF5082 family protein [Bacillus sp. T33-2]PLR92657.1 DUF5082 domain-containing protein [Bacillus sp. T33-2]